MTPIPTPPTQRRTDSSTPLAPPAASRPPDAAHRNCCLRRPSLIRWYAALAAICPAIVPTAPAAPSDSLVGYWRLENNANDSAPGGGTADNGSWVGGSAYTSTALFGSAASFDGSRHLSVPSSADIGAAGGSVTVSAWFKVSVFDRGWQAVVARGEGNHWRLARNAGGSNMAYAGGTGDITGGPAVDDGAWHHAVAVSEGGEQTRLFIDGVKVATGGAPSLTGGGNPMLIGNNPDASDRQWRGEIDDVGLFTTPLSDFQAQAIHTFGSTPAYGYELGEVVQILDAHAAGAGGSVTIDGDTWTFAASDPGGGVGSGTGFVLLAGDGSGVQLSTGPPVTSFTANPVFISSGQGSTLAWQVTPPFTTISISPTPGDVTSPETGVGGAGSVVVTPAATTVYTISATGPNGTTQRTATVFVDVDPTAPRINEFVANNATGGLTDEDGTTEDWIELYGPGPAPSDLSTYYLTDDPTNLTKWPFPATSIPAGGYLVVFASSKDRRVAGSELHTNFKLSAGGEYLALTRDDGAGGVEVVTDFSPGYPQQEEGASYGIDQDGVTVGYLATPTPGAANGASFAGFVADTSFSVKRGFFTAAFDVAITTTTPGATIRYTTDGSEPTETGGTVYTAPVSIASTTVLRAAAFKAGYLPTNVDTNTYLFLDDVRTQHANGATPPGWPGDNQINGHDFNYGMDPDITGRYTAQQMIDALSAIPSISIATTQGNLTDGSTGIYVNPSGHGRSWERPASFEVIHPDGATTNVQENCGLRIRGGASRSPDNPKHAFRLFFRKEYGAGKLGYPMFGNEGADKFDKMDLRTAQNYSWSFNGGSQNTFLREVLGRDLQALLGQPYTRSRYYHLYLNGLYWGLYMTQERGEAKFAATYLPGSDDQFDTIKSAGGSGGYNTEATDGTMAENTSDWWALWDMARQQRATPTLTRFMAMQGLGPGGARDAALPAYLDVDNLVEYMLCIGYTGNYDAPLSSFVGASNNWYSVRNRVRDDLGFQFLIHDGEHSLGANDNNWSANNDRVNTSNGSASRALYHKSNPQFIHLDLAESTAEYRLRFADRAHRALFNGGPLNPAAVLATLERRRSVVDSVIIAESARWGDSKVGNPRDREDWLAEVASLTSLIGSRSAVFLGQLRNAGLYPGLDAPSFSQHGGQVAAGTTISVTAPADATQVYYFFGAGDSDPTDWADDLDPRELGGAVKAGAGAIATPGGGTFAIPTPISNPGWMQARCYRSGTSEWSAMTTAFFTTAPAAGPSDIVISEIHYHPTAPTTAELTVDPGFDSDDFEFVEVMNISAATVDLGGAAFVLKPVGDHLEGIEVEFPPGTLIAPGERLLVVANRAAFTARYPGVAASKIAADYSGRLDNGGEWITLEAADGSTISSFRYDDASPWPIPPDGSGPSLALVDPASAPDPSLGASWAASIDSGGSPGEQEGTPFTGNPGDDLDSDGSNALLEYFIGTSDSSPSAGLTPTVGVETVGPDRFASITYRADPHAVDATGTPQVSADLVLWSSSPSDIVFVRSGVDTDGTPTLTYRSTAKLGAGTRIFLRLQVQQSP